MGVLNGHESGYLGLELAPRVPRSKVFEGYGHGTGKGIVIL